MTARSLPCSKERLDGMERGAPIIAKPESRQSRSVARVFGENWEGVSKGERLERLERISFKRFERSAAVERLERFEPSKGTGTERSESDFELLNLEPLNRR